MEKKKKEKDFIELPEKLVSKLFVMGKTIEDLQKQINFVNLQIRDNLESFLIGKDIEIELNDFRLTSDMKVLKKNK